MQTAIPARSRIRRLAAAFCGAVGIGAALAASAGGLQDGDGLGMSSMNPLARVIPGPQVRWQSSMAAFAAADRERAPAVDGTLFVGSSTIRLWSHLAEDFRDLPVINRGFGGSTMADCQYFARQLVLQYKPRQVLVYAGDNDLAEGRSPQQVLDSFRGFVDTVRGELPQVRISYISIKPSPLRANLMPKIREANTLLAAYVATLPNSAYIDIFTPMLDAAGNPRTELFGPDRLHMNDAGYALWTSVVGSQIAATPRAAGAVPLAAADTAALLPAGGTAVAQAGGARPTFNAMRAVYRP